MPRRRRGNGICPFPGFCASTHRNFQPPQRLQLQNSTASPLRLNSCQASTALHFSATFTWETGANYNSSSSSSSNNKVSTLPQGSPPLPPLPLPATLLAAHSTPFSTISVWRVQRCGCGSNNISTAVARGEIHSKKYCLAL